MNVSSELQSQVFSKNVIGRLLVKIGRTKWMEKYTVHDLDCEAWAVGIWVRQAGTIISYKDLAEFLREDAKAKAESLPVRRTATGWFVKSQQSDKNYFIHFNKHDGWKCNCMKFRCWNNRIPTEMPHLYDALNNKIFCHHIVAVYMNKN